MDFARFEFRMAKPGKDGVPFGEKMRALGASVLDQAPPCPPALAHVWEWFQSLNTGRTGSGFGMNPLTFSEISAWCALTGNTLTPWEVDLLKTLDVLYLKEMADHD